jgi:hypothetical protein
MNSFEDDLRSILRRQEPPDGFAGRVLVRVNLERARQGTRRLVWEGFWFRWVAAALALILLAVSFAEYHRRREAEAVRFQAILALRIASTQLNSALKNALEFHPLQAQTRSGGRSE